MYYDQKNMYYRIPLPVASLEQFSASSQQVPSHFPSNLIFVVDQVLLSLISKTKTPNLECTVSYIHTILWWVTPTSGNGHLPF